MTLIQCFRDTTSLVVTLLNVAKDCLTYCWSADRWRKETGTQSQRITSAQILFCDLSATQTKYPLEVASWISRWSQLLVSALPKTVFLWWWRSLYTSTINIIIRNSSSDAAAVRGAASQFAPSIPFNSIAFDVSLCCRTSEPDRLSAFTLLVVFEQSKQYNAKPTPSRVPTPPPPNCLLSPAARFGWLFLDFHQKNRAAEICSFITNI